MVANLPAGTRVVVLNEDGKVMFAGKLMDPPETYGFNYQIIPDSDDWPSPSLIPQDMVHPEPRKETDLIPVPSEAVREAAKQDARQEFEVTIATLRRAGISIPSIRAIFLSTLNGQQNDLHRPGNCDCCARG